MPSVTSAIHTIFAEALDRPAADRSAFLDAACGNDDALRAEVVDLLAAHGRAGRFLARAPRDDGTKVNEAGEGDTPPDAVPAIQPTVTRTLQGSPSPGPVAVAPLMLGGYRIERLLGEGGMGAVYLARDDKLGRAVALKTMRPEVAARPGAVERFLREAQTTARVAHDNVVPILHAGEDAGTPYIAMPLLEGEPLDALLKREPVPPLGVVLKVGRETADGLAAAHACGLVHRDIKPANIWLEGNSDATDPAARFRRVKLLDFGLARPAATDTQLTGSGAVLGTPAYMSPEQARGEPVDARTDLFSLGVVLYRMTTGQSPFTGPTTMAVLTSLAVDQPRAPATKNPNVPQALSDLITRLLAKDRNDRPGSAAEVAAALRRIGKGLSGTHRAFTEGARPTGGQPVPIAPPAEPQFNPWTEVEGTELPAMPAQAPPLAPAPMSPGPHRKKPTKAKRRTIGKWVAAGLASLLTLVLAAAVFRFETAEGTLVVEINDPEVESRFKDGKLVLVGPDGKERYTITAAEHDKKIDAGSYQLRVEGADGLTLDTSEFTLKRKGQVTVRVTLPRPPVTDRSVALWVISQGGTVGIFDGVRILRMSNSIEVPAEPITLREISLHKIGGIVDADLERLKGLKGLQHLNLGTTSITDAGLEHLKGLTELTALQVSCTRVTDAGLRHLTGLTKLTDLNLRDNPKIGGDGLKHIKKLNELASLDLNGSAVTDEGLAQLVGLTKLRTLLLVRTGASPAHLTPGGLEHLQGLQNLQHLELRGQPVGDAGLDHLTGLKGLKLLDVRDERLEKTKVAAGGVAKLAQALPQCRILWDGMPAIPGAVIERSAAEWVLTLGGTIRVNGEGRDLKAVADLPNGPFYVTAVDLRSKRGQVTDSGLVNLKSCARLTHLNLNDCNITDKGIDCFKDLKELTWIELADTRITDAGLAAFKERNLTGLVLGRTRVTDAGMANFAGCTKLRELNVSYTRVTDAGLAHFKGCDDLQTLILQDAFVTDKGAYYFKGSKKLVTLNLTRTKVTNAGLSHFASCESLVTLYLYHLSIDDDGLAYFRGCRALELVALSGTRVTDTGVAWLKECPNLKTLYMGGTKVTADAGAEIAKALPRCFIEWSRGVIKPAR